MIRFGRPECAGWQRAPFLVVQLDARVLVIDVQRGDHAAGDHPGTEPAWGVAADPAVKNQLHLIRSPDIQVLANDFLQQDPATDRRSRT